MRNKPLIIMLFIALLFLPAVYADDEPTSTPEPTDTPTPTSTPEPTDTPTPTSTPTPTPTPTPVLPNTPVGSDKVASFFSHGIRTDLITTSEINVGIDTGAADDYKVAIPGLKLRHGTTIFMWAKTASTAASTLKLNGGTAIPIKKADSATDTVAGTIAKDQFYILVYNSQKGVWTLLNASN